MIRVRPAAQRGHFDHGWLDTYHTFSFADYMDANHMGFRTLRVINDDVIAPGAGFGMHPHRDMEIITYVVSGAIRHRDSRGNDAILPAGGIQVMSAGRGIVHSEFNGSDEEHTRLLQIWILPSARGVEPQYADRAPRRTATTGEWDLIASGDATVRTAATAAPSGVAANGALPIHQDARVFHVQLGAGQTTNYPLESGRAGWLQVVDGALRVNGQDLARGDGAAIEDVSTLTIAADSDADFLFFDLA